MALMLRDVRIAGYRSLRSIHFPVGRLSVFVGANGVGKTNLYRALELLQASAAGTLAHALAAEGSAQGFRAMRVIRAAITVPTLEPLINAYPFSSPLPCIHNDARPFRGFFLVIIYIGALIATCISNFTV